VEVFSLEHPGSPQHLPCQAPVSFTRFARGGDWLIGAADDRVLLWPRGAERFVDRVVKVPRGALPFPT
jgi:hypothetical protein